MNKLMKMRACDWVLMVLTVVMLVSGFQLEVIHGDSPFWGWVHIVLGVAFFVLIGWHLYLHFQWRNWFKLLFKQKSPVTRWLFIFALLTLVTAIMATVHWARDYAHSGIGGFHGKLGFIFISLAIAHTLKRLHSPILHKPKNRKAI